jgi:hypothetical protein
VQKTAEESEKNPCRRGKKADQMNGNQREKGQEVRRG